MIRSSPARIGMALFIAITALAGCRPRVGTASAGEGSALTVGFAGGSLCVERGECPGFDADVIREWADRAFADMSAAWPDRVKRFRVSGLRLSGRREPAPGGEPAHGYWDRDRATVVFRCGDEEVVRHELFHVWCERAHLPCDCDRIDHPGGFDLQCRPAGSADAGGGSVWESNPPRTA